MPVRKPDFEQTDYKASTRYGLHLHTLSDDEYVEQAGTFSDPRGMVEIWTLRATKRPAEWTTLNTIHGGRSITRRWKRAWSRKTLPQLCRQFLTEIAT